MNKEEFRVLEMVANGVVTASDGYELLSALGVFGDTADSKRAMFPEHSSALGKDTGVAPKASFMHAGMDFREVELVSEEVAEGRTVLVMGESAGNEEPLSLSLSQSSGDNLLEAFFEDSGLLSIGEWGGKRVLFWTSGRLSIRLPKTLAFVRVSVKGGNVTAEDVSAPLELKTLGGEIQVFRPANIFSAKATGGGVSVFLDSSFRGESEVKAMGGGVLVRFFERMPIGIEAKSLGGSISISEKEADVSSSVEDFGKSRMSVRFGDNASPPRLSLTSMGGSISIGAMKQ